MVIEIMNLSKKKVLVIGTGKSGIAAVKLLQKMDAEVFLFDSNKALDKTELEKKLDGNLTEIILGELPEQVKTSVEIVILSPGVPTDIPMVNELRDAGKKIWGEIELGYLYEKGKVVAITGTNGKTTTTSLVGEILADYYKDVFVVGNIGNPYTLEVEKTTENSFTVAEISSFQLETTETFKPVVSAILNITPDHLDRHHSMEGYIAAKNRVAAAQTKEDVCVLNYDNEYTNAFGKECNAGVIYFSSQNQLENGLYLDGENIYWNHGGNPEYIMNIHDMNLVGMCNIENVMAAIAISVSMKVPMESILSTVRKFKAVEHRIEFVATKNGVDYYNDSKGTNPDAAIQGIKAMSKPTVLIGGGYDKHSEYDEWIQAFDGKVKALVLIGQTREKIKETALQYGVENIILADTFEECFKICVEQAAPGDAVLLSPACASWGMFPNYEVRGKMFKEYVHAIKE